jgi:hypothetical protein
MNLQGLQKSSSGSPGGPSQRSAKYLEFIALDMQTSFVRHSTLYLSHSQPCRQAGLRDAFSHWFWLDPFLVIHVDPLLTKTLKQVEAARWNFGS